MNTLVMTNFGDDIKEPTFMVWVKPYSVNKFEIYWQGESFVMAIYKVVAAKTRGWWYVKLEWKE